MIQPKPNLGIHFRRDPSAPLALQVPKQICLSWSRMSLRSAPVWKLPARPWTRPVLQAKHRCLVGSPEAINPSSLANLILPKQARCRQVRYIETAAGDRIQRPILEHEELFHKEGVPGFLSKDAFNVAWRDQQQYLIDELDRRTTRELRPKKAEEESRD